MQEPTLYDANLAQGVQGNVGRRLPYFILPILVVALVGTGLYWVQWASQRGIGLGYPMPVVHISSAPTGQLLVRNDEQFSASASGRDISYIWDFGDGTTDYGPTVSHTYRSVGSFNVTVRVTDAIDQTSTDTTSVRIVPPAPTASFTYSVSSGYVSFDASGSTADSSTSITSYRWDFGDGNTDPNGSSQEYHQYYYSGTYQVSLVVTDATGQSSNAYTSNVVIY